MACLTEEQVEQLSQEAGNNRPLRMLDHVERCDSCRKRVEQARENARVVADLRELRASREPVQQSTDQAVQ